MLTLKQNGPEVLAKCNNINSHAQSIFPFQIVSTLWHGTKSNKGTNDSKPLDSQSCASPIYCKPPNS